MSNPTYLGGPMRGISHSGSIYLLEEDVRRTVNAALATNEERNATITALRRELAEARAEIELRKSANNEVAAMDKSFVFAIAGLTAGDFETMKAEVARLTAANEALQARYTWCANELLACDYGDNPTGGKEMGWIVYGWRDRKDPRKCIYGASIDIAVDAARKETSQC